MRLTLAVLALSLAACSTDTDVDDGDTVPDTTVLDVAEDVRGEEQGLSRFKHLF